jgi:hypothetical protein
MEPKQYQAKAFPVEAVQITNENIDQVARWCSGTVKTHDNHTYVAWGVAGVNPRMAFVGDWVCLHKMGFFGQQFKAVPQSDFERYFEKQLEDPTPAVREILRTTLAKGGVPGNADEVLDEALKNILEVFREGVPNGE